MSNSNNHLEYFMRNKIFKLTISKYVSYFKIVYSTKWKTLPLWMSSISQDVRLEWESYHVYIPIWIPCNYFFFRSNLLRIIDTKYAIIIKNNEKPKAETNETPPSED